MRIALVAVVASLALVGCGSSGSDSGNDIPGFTSGGSCTQTSGSVAGCTDFDKTMAQVAKGSCTGENGQWSDSACSSANRVGRCKVTVSAGGFSTTSVLSFYAPTTAAEAQQACTAMASSGSATTEWIP